MLLRLLIFYTINIARKIYIFLKTFNILSCSSTDFLPFFLPSFHLPLSLPLSISPLFGALLHSLEFRFSLALCSCVKLILGKSAVYFVLQCVVFATFLHIHQPTSASASACECFFCIFFCLFVICVLLNGVY